MLRHPVWDTQYAAVFFFLTTWKWLTAVSQTRGHSQTTYMKFTRSTSSSLYHSIGLLVASEHTVVCWISAVLSPNQLPLAEPCVRTCRCCLCCLWWSAEFLQGNSHLRATFNPPFVISLFYFLVLFYFFWFVLWFLFCFLFSALCISVSCVLLRTG